MGRRASGWMEVGFQNNSCREGQKEKSNMISDLVVYFNTMGRESTARMQS